MEKEITQYIVDAKECLDSLDIITGTTYLNLAISKINQSPLSRSIVNNKKSEIYLLLGEVSVLQKDTKKAYIYFLLSIFYRPDHYKPYEKLYSYSPTFYCFANIWLNLHIQVTCIIYTLSTKHLLSSYLQRLYIVSARLHLKKEGLNQSKKLFQKATNLSKTTSKTHYWLGYYYFCTQEYQKAIFQYNRALERSPPTIEILSSLIDSYCCSGQLAEAIQLFYIYDNSLFSNVVKRKLFLGTHDLARGWYYTNKTKTHNQLIASGLDYTSEVSCINKTDSLYILAMWGIGDEVRWSVMYNYILDSTTPKIKIVCEPRLHSLLSRSFPKVEFISSSRLFSGKITSENLDNYNQLPHYYLSTVFNNDLFTHVVENKAKVTTILDILQLTNSSFDEFNKRSSLIPHPFLTDKWKSKLNELGHGLKVGICWKSGITNSERNIHYFPIDLWDDILTIPNVNFINLQYEFYESDLNIVEQKNFIIHHFEELDLKNDFEAASALISNLDLVISPCTAIIELAGALDIAGLMLNNSGEGLWRVKSNGFDLWHPSIKHILPDTFGDKKSALKNLYCELTQRAKQFPQR